MLIADAFGGAFNSLHMRQGQSSRPSINSYSELRDHVNDEAKQGLSGCEPQTTMLIVDCMGGIVSRPSKLMSCER